MSDEELDEWPDAARSAIARLADENALLRAALSEARARLGELEATSNVDAATGLPCEGALAEQLERTVGRASRHGTPAALITIDIKGLAGINDRHGRVTGDAALAHVGRLLKELVRSTDLVARSGGGFSLLLDHLDPDSAIETGERIARLIAERPLDAGSDVVSLQATVGVATILPGDSAGDVLHRAERNRERVKQF